MMMVTAKRNPRCPYIDEAASRRAVLERSKIPMFYKKNIPNRQRVLRVLLGIALISAGYSLYGRSKSLVGFAVAGALMALTGFVGYCPVCSIAKRASTTKSTE